MMGWGQGMLGWGGIFGGFFMIIFWILIILGIVLLVKWLMEQNKKGRQVYREMESPMEILKKRYARGKIDQKEFEEKKKALKD